MMDYTKQTPDEVPPTKEPNPNDQPLKGPLSPNEK